MEKYAKGGLVVGDYVEIVSDNDSYDDFRDEELIIESISDDGYGETMYELSYQNDDTQIPFSFYEYELEKVYAKGGDLAIDNLNKITDFREKMASYIAYQKSGSTNKSDSWYDKTERKLLNKSYKDLYKQYKELGGKQEIEDFGTGGFLLGNMLGGYLGYKLGKSMEQDDDVFGSERKFAQKVAKSVGKKEGE